MSVSCLSHPSIYPLCLKLASSNSPFPSFPELSSFHVNDMCSRLALQDLDLALGRSSHNSNHPQPPSAREAKTEGGAAAAAASDTASVLLALLDRRGFLNLTLGSGLPLALRKVADACQARCSVAHEKDKALLAKCTSAQSLVSER